MDRTLRTVQTSLPKRLPTEVGGEGLRPLPRFLKQNTLKSCPPRVRCTAKSFALSRNGKGMSLLIGGYAIALPSEQGRCSPTCSQKRLGR
jgi:hypothetical protein